MRVGPISDYLPVNTEGARNAVSPKHLSTLHGPCTRLDVGKFLLQSVFGTSQITDLVCEHQIDIRGAAEVLPEAFESLNEKAKPVGLRAT